MNRHPMDMMHDESVHEGMRRLAFLLGLAAAIVALHGILYRFVF